uniref:Uncharacterized protein n=1 Tax=Fagus sylvatica TaxID=28930 RepID=A0A2N9FKQ9_FAGSY
MSTLKAAFDSAKPTFSNILKTLKPNIMIYDILQPWAPVAAYEENIEAVMLLTCGTAVSSFMTFYSNNDPSKEYPFQAFNFSHAECQKICHFLHYTANGVKNKERYLQCIEKSSSIVLIKTTREIESKYIDYLSDLVGKEIVTVGPLVQEPTSKDAYDDMVIIEWLNKKEPSSVVFVSCGSEYFLALEEMEEIASGLELSKVSFIWVVRFHGGDKITISEALPEGFLERIGERGMVVEGWAPQAKILGHSSIGGFVSHCGWSLTLEGMMFGVPIIAMPTHLDQPLNAKLVVEVGVGVEVPRENEKLKGEEVAKVIKKVVMQEEGKEVRKKATQVSERMKDKGDGDMDVVVEKLQASLAAANLSYSVLSLKVSPFMLCVASHAHNHLTQEKENHHSKEKEQKRGEGSCEGWKAAMATPKHMMWEQQQQLQMQRVKNSGIISCNGSPIKDDKEEELSRSALAIFHAKEEEIEKKKMEVKDKVHSQLGRVEEATKRLAEIREEREYKEALEAFNEKNREKAQLLTKLMELVGESERMRMKKLEELSKNVDTVK